MQLSKKYYKDIQPYIEEIKDNMRVRARLLSVSHKSQKSQIIARCRKNFKWNNIKLWVNEDWCGIITSWVEEPWIVFFFNNFLFTRKNGLYFGDEFLDYVPFKLFDFQEEFVRQVWMCIVTGQWVFIEKSRQMWITWMLAGIFLYGYLFHDYDFLNVSKTGELVDKIWDIKSFFERIRYMVTKLPTWMLPEWFSKKYGTIYNKLMWLSKPRWAGAITGETANPQASRGWTYKAIFLDEMAFMRDAKSINGSATQATGCKIINSTPNGKWNEYYAMRELAIKHKIHYIRLHWTLHPFYNEEWYKWRINEMTEEDIARELEINYSAAIEWRVYPDFKDISDWWVIQIWSGEKFSYDPLLPLYISIDNSHGGKDPHAIIVAQTDLWTNKIRIINTVQVNCSITHMANFMAWHPIAWFQMTPYLEEFFADLITYKQAIFICDPHDIDSTQNDTTIRQEYSKVGITLVKPRMWRSARWSEIEEQIRITTNNMHRLKVNKKCTDFMWAIEDSRYPETKENSNRVTPNSHPVHNWTSHFRTSLEYLMTFLATKEVRAVREAWSNIPQRIEVKDPVTGQIRIKIINK
jgi:hypothetical protein